MSRIGKKEIEIPAGVEVTVADDGLVVVKNSGTELSFQTKPEIIKVTVAESKVVCEPVGGVTNKNSALWGTTRARIQNMITGVTEGWKKQLEIQGVGYKAKLNGKNLELALGFSHPVKVEAPEGITFEVENEIITISGADKQLVGQVAADIRKQRKPEPYKGKGVRYVGEHVRRKVGKVVGAAE